jgi:hypothetical protein
MIIDYNFFLALQHAFFIGFMIGKTLNKRCPKTITNPCRSLATNPANLEILLQSTTKSDYQSAYIRSSVDCHTPACRPLVSWPLRLVVDVFVLRLRLVVDVVVLRLRLWVNPPWLDFHYKEYNNPTMWIWIPNQNARPGHSERYPHHW